MINIFITCIITISIAYMVYKSKHHKGKMHVNFDRCRLWRYADIHVEHDQSWFLSAVTAWNTMWLNLIHVACLSITSYNIMTFILIHILSFLCLDIATLIPPIFHFISPYIHQLPVEVSDAESLLQQQVCVSRCVLDWGGVCVLGWDCVRVCFQVPQWWNVTLGYSASRHPLLRVQRLHLPLCSSLGTSVYRLAKLSTLPDRASLYLLCVPICEEES